MIYVNETLTHNKGEDLGAFMGTYCSGKKNKRGNKPTQTITKLNWFGLRVWSSKAVRSFTYLFMAQANDMNYSKNNPMYIPPITNKYISVKYTYSRAAIFSFVLLDKFSDVISTECRFIHRLLEGLWDVWCSPPLPWGVRFAQLWTTAPHFCLFHSCSQMLTSCRCVVIQQLQWGFKSSKPYSCYSTHHSWNSAIKYFASCMQKL